MPQVRIISRLREYPTELVRDLRARGFDVETCLSQDEQQQAADLEITLDQSSPEGMSESISRALASKDVVILAGDNANGGKIRSIGMVLMSSEADVQTARKTPVPVQLNEIYTALLRGRLRTRKSPVISISPNWQSAWQKAVLASRQTISRAGVWAKSKKWNLGTGANSPETEPDLVPSMFNLSGAADVSNELPAQKQEVTHAANTENRSIFSFWKPIGVGVVAILAVTLWLHGFSLSGVKAEPASAENKKDMNAQSATSLPGAQALQQAGTYDAASATKILAKSHPGDDDSFQDVVVRHFNQPASRELPKDGIKRRVVVD